MWLQPNNSHKAGVSKKAWKTHSEMQLSSPERGNKFPRVWAVAAEGEEFSPRVRLTRMGVRLLGPSSYFTSWNSPSQLQFSFCCVELTSVHEFSRLSQYKKENTFSPSFSGFMSLRTVVGQLAEDMLWSDTWESSKKVNKTKQNKKT